MYVDFEKVERHRVVRRNLSPTILYSHVSTRHQHFLFQGQLIKIIIAIRQFHLPDRDRYLRMCMYVRACARALVEACPVQIYTHAVKSLSAMNLVQPVKKKETMCTISMELGGNAS